MRYFTPDWMGFGPTDWLALPSDVAAEREQAVMDDYRAHVARLLPSIPAELHDLVEGRTSLHDALVMSAWLDEPADGLRIVLRCGELDDERRVLELRYGALHHPLPAASCLEELVTHRATALYDEFDRDDAGRLVHRILFWIGGADASDPHRELEVSFESLRVASGSTAP